MATGYGRFQTPEAPSALRQLHLHDGTTPLKAVDHETPVAVLDQSDLLAQGIHTSRFIPGARDEDSLGSCTAQAALEALARKLPLVGFLAVCTQLINHAASQAPTSYTTTAGIERAAVAFYYRCTHQTGDPQEEWPPTDCGSSGPYIVQLLQRMGVIKGQKIAHAGTDLVSLLQADGVLMGSPFFYAWEEPDTHGFIDGNGHATDLEGAIASGVAGGHETYIAAIEKITLLPTGRVDAFNTVLRVRNHWRRSWGDHGCFRVHLSTLAMIAGQCDFRQLV
jgi:hypothetical protein